MHALRKFLPILTLAVMVGLIPTTASAQTYYPPAIGDFDGSSDYLKRNSYLTGNVDGKHGTVSAWVRFDGNGAIARIFGNESNRLAFHGSAGKMVIFARNSDGTTILQKRSIEGFIAVGSGWHHVLASWDLAASESLCKIYIDDIDRTEGGGTYLNQTIDNTRASWAIGAMTTGSQKLNGAIAELWLDTTAWTDLTVESNRRKFISADGYPVDLGPSGYLPTGVPPVLYMKTQYNNGGENSGTGGDFYLVGAPAYTPGPVHLLPLTGGGGPGARGARGGLIR